MTAFSSNRVIGIAMGVLCFANACAFNSKGPPNVPPDDPNLFLAVVEGVRQSAGPSALAIDPRPLRADPDVLEANASTRAHVAEASVEVRRSVLHRLSIAETDDPTYQKCAGVLVGPAPPGQADPRVNCPDKSLYVAAIGLPRAGGAYIPSGAINERNAGLQSGHVAVRVLLTHLSPQGATMTAYDYVFNRGSGGWNLVKRVSLFVTD